MESLPRKHLLQMIANVLVTTANDVTAVVLDRCHCFLSAPAMKNHDGLTVVVEGSTIRRAPLTLFCVGGWHLHGIIALTIHCAAAFC